MGEGKIVRRGGGAKTAIPSITVVSTSPTGVTFTLTNNDDNAAVVSYNISTSTGAVSLASSATSSNITVDLTAGTYTLTAVATVVGEVATQSTAAVEIVQILVSYELLHDSGSLASATTTYTIDNLNISKSDNLVLVSTLLSSNAGLRIGINGNNTITNYNVQVFESYGTSFTYARVNDNRIGRAINSGTFISKIKLNEDGDLLWKTHMNFRYTEGLTEIVDYYGSSTFTSSSITRIDLTSSETNGTLAGSRFQLYKVRD